VSRTPIIECVPNFSEGRNKKAIQAIAGAMDAVPGAQLLHLDSGYDANRTVITVAGPPQAVFASAEAGIIAAMQLIDMRRQQGVHPRLGAVDVCPFISLQHISKTDLLPLVEDFASQLAEKRGIPIYLYAHSARRPARVALSAIRKGEFEGLKEKMKHPDGLPDLGPLQPHSSFGAMVMGVRDLMIAYNIHLTTKDVAIARRIAGDLRGSGRILVADGNKHRKPGRFPSLKAIGWSMASYGWAQVSMNIMNYKESPLHEVYEAAKERAAVYGVSVQGSELIGLAPKEALWEAGKYYARKSGEKGPLEEEQCMAHAVRGLGLDRLGSFSHSERLLESLLAKSTE